MTGDEKISLAEGFAPSAQNTRTCEPLSLIIQSGGSSRMNGAGRQPRAESKERRVCFITKTRFHLAEYRCFWRECQGESRDRIPARLFCSANSPFGNSTWTIACVLMLFSLYYSGIHIPDPGPFLQKGVNKQIVQCGSYQNSNSRIHESGQQSPSLLPAFELLGPYDGRSDSITRRGMTVAPRRQTPSTSCQH